MEPIASIDLAKVLEGAEKSFQKEAETHVARYLRQLIVERHNLKMKGLRLSKELHDAMARAAELDQLLAEIQAGDWSGIKPIEIPDKVAEKDK